MPAEKYTAIYNDLKEKIEEGLYAPQSILPSENILMRGTPYIYQGEEIGMTNAGYTSIEQYGDVESTNYFDILRSEGKTVEEALHIIGERSRDNGRTPMQWDASEYAGFTTGTPWLGIPANHSYINVEEEEKDNRLAIIKSWYSCAKTTRSSPTEISGSSRPARQM